jgi:alanine racemase
MVIPSFNQILINREDLRHNFAVLAGRLSLDTDMLAMVKSEAYGHGLQAAAAAFASSGCTLFGVAELGEGVALRESGCEGSILVFLGFDADYCDYFLSHDLTPVLFSREDLAVFGDMADRKKTSASVYLKFDCGMSRLGFKPHEAEEVISRVAGYPRLRLKGIISHYPCSDNRYSENSRDVYRLFSSVCKTAAQKHEALGSICNSGGLLYFPETCADMARSGISLYGYYPDGKAGRNTESSPQLRPAMSFVSRVLQINDVSAGSGVSYGHTFIAEKDMRLAVLPVGYSDGYPRLLSNRGEVLINGTRAPIRGRICMNLCMVEITGIQGVRAGDEVVLLGSQGKETIDADEIGDWAGTVNYEILCSLGNNNQRVFV